MAARRLSISRLAGIAAWTAASVTWGTAFIAVADAPTASVPTAAPGDDGPADIIAGVEAETRAAMPTMPESGLVVVRYTPTERPAPRVTVRQVVTGPAPPAATTAPSSPAPPTRETSSGS